MRPQARSRTLPSGGPGAAGVGLVEILFVLAVTGVVSAGLCAYFLTTSQAFSDQAVVARMLQNAGTAMTRIAQDIRKAGTFWAAPCALAGSNPGPLVKATNSPAGQITIRVMLDDPSLRTEVTPSPPAGQSQSNSILRVVSTDGFHVGDTAFISDGIECTRFTVTNVIAGTPPGLQHDPTRDLNSPGGTGYLYPATTTLMYRLSVDQRVVYAIDTSNPTVSWLTRDTGTEPGKLVPDIESLHFSYVMSDGQIKEDPSTVATAEAANIRIVTVSVTSKADKKSPVVGNDGYRRQTLTSGVQLRNVRQ